MFFKVDSMPARLVLLTSMLVGGVITRGEVELEDAFDPNDDPSFVEFSLTDDPRALGVGRDTVGLNDDPEPTLVSPLNIELLQGSELTDADLLAADVTVLLGAPHNPSDPIDDVEGENSGPHELNSGEDCDSRLLNCCCVGHIVVSVLLVKLADKDVTAAAAAGAA
jgi:hypothetical protein